MNKKKIIQSLMIAGAISLFGFTLYARVSFIKKQIIDRETELNNVLQEYNTLKEQYISLEGSNVILQDELTNIKGDVEALQKEKEKLKEAIYEMTKKVSFNQGDVRITSGATEYHLKKALRGTDLFSLAGAFVRAEKEYNINAYFLASIVALESGWGKSTRAKNGSNNLTGYAVYEDYSPGKYFSSKEECILETARLLSEDYLNPEGQYYSGGYTTYHVNIKYSADENWCLKVENIIYTLLELSNMEIEE